MTHKMLSRTVLRGAAEHGATATHRSAIRNFQRDPASGLIYKVGLNCPNRAEEDGINEWVTLEEVAESFLGAVDVDRFEAYAPNRKK